MIQFPRWKMWLVLVTCLATMVFALPNAIPQRVLDQLPSWLPKHQVNLGLDLQGGAHLLLQVDTDAVVREVMQGLQDSARQELRRANIAVAAVSTDSLTRFTVRLGPGADRDAARRTLVGLDSGLDVTLTPDGSAVVTKTEQALRERRIAAVQQSIEIIRRRVDETGTKEPTIVQQGVNRILIQLPGVRDPERIKALIGTTAKLTFRLVDQDISAEEARRTRVPATSDLLPGDRPDPVTGQLPYYVVRKRIMVSGDNLVDAQPSFQDGMPVVSFRFDSVGARRFGDVTLENVGRPFAIVLDDKVISAPVIREAITGGRGIISGSFTAQSASDLALLLRAGALPAPLTILEERSVGPSLGADSIQAGALACILGFMLIGVMMVAFYGLFGLFANVALILNLVITLAFMSAIGATLTLPGLAGMTLGLAMSVDANVLIYERMREEGRLGRGVVSAIDAGFGRAFLTILDSNLTTLIAAVLLYLFGTGPVRGFAVTLGIGIVASLFTAIMVTRLMVVLWLRASRRNELPV
ncbi:MAG: protein translocase subunit SecD [Alphaproteobacteria bacterium]|nr:protein translocase subunit SecD [Alphaproteobacteria bacterium]TAD87651.1 MAG: protein translocase subunit SecD [Alphaproteobacteria bacterium]